MSLVELMVGIAVGLLIVAGSTTVVATQLADSRRLVVEAQIQQDLRASADVVVRELRRAGAWDSAYLGVWAPSPAAAAAISPYDAADSTLLGSNSTLPIKLAGATAQGFRLRTGTAGVLELQDTNGTWQALTDSVTLNVTDFSWVLVPISSTPMACPQYCDKAGGQQCWPTIEVRALRIQVTGRSVSDPNVVRQIQSTVRLRNDHICNNRDKPCDPSPTKPLCPDTSP